MQLPASRVSQLGRTNHGADANVPCARITHLSLMRTGFGCATEQTESALNFVQELDVHCVGLSVRTLEIMTILVAHPLRNALFTAAPALWHAAAPCNEATPSFWLPIFRTVVIVSNGVKKPQRHRDGGPILGRRRGQRSRGAGAIQPLRAVSALVATCASFRQIGAPRRCPDVKPCRTGQDCAQ